MFQELFRKVAFVISLMFLIIVIAAPVFGQVYTYTTATADDTYVNGAGYVTGYYNSSTHVYTTSVTVTSPSGRSATASCGGTYCSASLSIGYEDGQYFANSTMVGTCPNVQGGSHPLGGSGSSVQVKPFISITSAAFDKVAICNTQTSGLIVQVEVSCSVAAAGQVGITVSESSRTGDVYYTLSPVQGVEQIKAVNCGPQINTYTWTLTNNNALNTGNKVKLGPYVSSAPTTTPGVEVRNSPRESSELTLNGACPP
ncbi:MAG: hypothetical protein U0Z53_14660 [Blastocatellia bacterium]